MKSKLFNNLFLPAVMIFTLIMVTGCTKTNSTEELQAEYVRMGTELTTSSIYAFGDSLTSGYSYGTTNDTMYFVKGDTSYGTFVAAKLGNSVGTSNVEFTYPSDLTATCAGQAANNDFTCYPNLTHGAPFNLLGVPGVRIEDLESSAIIRDYFSVSAQGLFSLIVRNTSNTNSLYLSSMADQLVLAQPTLTLIWIGANNILGPTTSGYVTSSGADSTPLSKADFKTHLEALISKVKTQTNSQIILANLPSPTAIPFVTATNQALTNGNVIGLFMVENNVTDFQMLSSYGGQILASAASDILAGTKGGMNAPLLDSDWLSEAELATLNTRLSEYNTAIDEVGTAYNVPVVDMNSVFNAMISGTETTTGMGLNFENAFGGDSVHPSETGQKGIANMFIKKINETFGTSYELYTP